MPGEAHPSPKRGLLGWLGLGPEAEATAPPLPLAEAPHWRAGRRQLLAAIGDFLEAHDLPADAIALTVAHAFVTGSDGTLCRVIEERLRSGAPLDTHWLDALADDSEGAAEKVAQRLLTRLEANLDAFSQTTSSARQAANDCADDFAATMGQIDSPESPASLLRDITQLAVGLLDRTRALERDMARSEVRTRALRHSLDDARRVSEEDPLTGLPNRRAFEKRYAEACEHARASGTPLCVAICDIDEFKRINDTHGHDTGDRVLRSVGVSLSRIAASDCHVARHGGEEFVIILHGRTLHEAWELLDDARSAQAERRMVNREDNAPIGKVTFSAGVVNVFAWPDPRAALRAADEALYKAKREGRNRVRTAEPPPSGGEAQAA